MTLAIRRLHPEEAPSWRALRMEGLARDPRSFRWAPEDEIGVEPERDRHRLRDELVAGAFHGDTLVGILGLSRSVGARIRHNGLLWGMYVRRDARRQGIAEQLMEWMLGRAREMSLLMVHLTVLSGNAGALHLYERLGFTVYGIAPAAVRIGDELLDELLMVRAM